MASSPRITKEIDCYSSNHNRKKANNNTTNALFDTPAGNHIYPGRIASGSGVRTLPRLSASEAVHNFRDINSEKGGTVQYRHVS